MLTITVPGQEFFDETTSEFFETPSYTLELEHSLVSLSKWESRFEKPFLGKDEKSTEEVIGYIECMTLTPGIPSEVFQRLTQNNLDEINAYIGAKMTATTFKELPKKATSTEYVSAELIYYWMVALNIPSEYEDWHLNRLFTLIKVANEKNQPQKKMSRREAIAQQRALNAQRRAQAGSNG